MKEVNAKAQKIIGMAYSVLIVIDRWKRKHDILVVSLDYFDVILSMDFLRKVKVSLMPYLDDIMTVDKNCPCFVQYCKALMASGNKKKKSLFSAIIFDKDL